MVSLSLSVSPRHNTSFNLILLQPLAVSCASCNGFGVLFFIKSLYYYVKRLRVTMEIFIPHRDSLLFLTKCVKVFSKLNLSFSQKNFFQICSNFLGW